MYKLRHIPTGLYYQPHKSGGSNLSIRGKVYQTNLHGLSSALRRKDRDNTFSVFVEENSSIHKLTKDILIYTECRWSRRQLKAITLLTDWIKEEI